MCKKVYQWRSTTQKSSQLLTKMKYFRGLQTGCTTLGSCTWHLSFTDCSHWFSSCSHSLRYYSRSPFTWAGMNLTSTKPGKTTVKRTKRRLTSGSTWSVSCPWPTSAPVLTSASSRSRSTRFTPCTPIGKLTRHLLSFPECFSWDWQSQLRTTSLSYQE